MLIFERFKVKAFVKFIKYVSSIKIRKKAAKRRAGVITFFFEFAKAEKLDEET